MSLLSDKFQQFACPTCQGKALGFKKAVRKDESAVKDVSLSHVGPAKAAVDSQCPVCLGGVKKAGKHGLLHGQILHCTKFTFIWWWAKGRDVCKQSLGGLPYSVGGGNHYEEYVVGLCALLHSKIAMRRTCS